MTLHWVIAGGGTGGHVTLGLALAEVIAERGDEIVFIGSDRSLEARLVPEAGFELVALPSPQVMGRSLLGRIRGVLGILGLVARARRGGAHLLRPRRAHHGRSARTSPRPSRRIETEKPAERCAREPRLACWL